MTAPAFVFAPAPMLTVAVEAELEADYEPGTGAALVAHGLRHDDADPGGVRGGDGRGPEVRRVDSRRMMSG